MKGATRRLILGSEPMRGRAVSIRAPVKGATADALQTYGDFVVVSIRAPVKGATSIATAITLESMFRSAPP